MFAEFQTYLRLALFSLKNVVLGFGVEREKFHRDD